MLPSVKSNQTNKTLNHPHPTPIMSFANIPHRFSAPLTSNAACAQEIMRGHAKYMNCDEALVSDLRDLHELAEMVLDDNLATAWGKAQSLDSFVRDFIPTRAWEYMRDKAHLRAPGKPHSFY